MVCKTQPLIQDLIFWNRYARIRHANIHCKRERSRIAAGFQTLCMLKDGTRKCVYFYFREEVKKITLCYTLEICLSQLWRSSRYPAVFLEQQQGSKVRGTILHGKELLKFCWGLFLSCSLLSLQHRIWVLCQRGKKPTRFWDVLFGWLWCLGSVLCSSIHTGDAVLFRPFLYHSFLPASIISSFLNCQILVQPCPSQLLRLYGAPLSVARTKPGIV